MLNIVLAIIAAAALVLIPPVVSYALPRSTAFVSVVAGLFCLLAGFTDGPACFFAAAFFGLFALGGWSIRRQIAPIHTLRTARQSESFVTTGKHDGGDDLKLGYLRGAYLSPGVMFARLFVAHGLDMIGLACLFAAIYAAVFAGFAPAAGAAAVAVVVWVVAYLVREEVTADVRHCARQFDNDRREEFAEAEDDEKKALKLAYRREVAAFRSAAIPRVDTVDMALTAAGVFGLGITLFVAFA